MSDTPRARALAKELRAARSAAGLTARELARALGWSEAKVSRIETARRGILVQNVEAILDVLGMKGGDRERLLKMARDIREPAWWELGRELPQQLTALIDAEQRAKTITDVTLNVLPGLLQTRTYTRTVMEASGVPEDRIDDHVSIRQVRQGILSKRNPATLRCFIDETAMTRPIGGAKVMADQLQKIISAVKEPNVTVRVIPLSIGAHAGLSGTFVLFEFGKPRPVVYLEARRSGAFIDEPDDVALFFDAVERLEDHASDLEASQEILQKYLEQYESEAK
ncbi:helix-turn-helix transcriptional regulator [Saccharopolyspora spinosa]|uniref:Helix-turn-helix protein n=1 Tax=Saccharopolyspora spinosa TaxID=60894 RepID=A0A2N3XRR7_SACSN|nr:helix-turn-helix transcriptional regulator [Saccharopolyspora spinosa]PKW13363.1 helix-turn-helix protein [Saccharopolyspora spinosa]